MIVLGAINGATSYRRLIPSCTVGNGLHSLSSWFKVCLGWLVNAYSSHSIHKTKEVGPQGTHGSIHGMQGDGFKTELGGTLEVTMWLCALFGSRPNYVVLVMDNLVLVLGNEGGGPHHT